MGKPLWAWAVFLSIILLLLAVDLGVLHRRQRVIGVRESIYMSAFYIIISLLFASWIGHQFGAESAKEYLAAFLIEKSLSMDNIFIISFVFSFLSIPMKYQHRVLFWGILGVIVLRAIMIGFGAVLVDRFEYILYIFAVFLIATGIKILVINKPLDMRGNFLLKFMRRHICITKELHEGKFFVKQTIDGGKSVICYTSLFVALIFIECIDFMFAVDSIPAIFAITNNTYVIYTSNIFAILGLRALYFALAVIIHRFRYIKYALAMILIFIGSKIFIADLLGMEKFPVDISLSVTLLLLAGGISYSLYKTR
jgi:tellurite resistance protein TerC